VTALDLITDALRDIGVISEIESPSAEQGDAAVSRLNDLMASLAEDGIDLGYAPISATTDTVVIPDGHVSTIKALLAIKCAPMYAGSEVPPLIAASADAGYTRLLKQALLLQNTAVIMGHMSLGAGSQSSYDITTGY
jgi:hypothetical protein